VSLPLDDALNKILGWGFSGDDHPYPRATIVRAGMGDGRTEHWRCLVCLAGGQGAPDGVALGIEVHLADCEGDPLLASARADLLEAISDASQGAFAAGWLSGVEKILLLRGGLWALLADALGWPYGHRGLIEWDTDLDSALARYGATRADLDVQPVPGRRKGDN
jgi:hypothetical protein